MGKHRENEVSHNARTYVREIGTAVAVLSLYLLVLLAPLHQAAGLQRDLDALGYASLDLWPICQPLSVDGTQELPDVAKCPVAGIGKHELIPLTPASIDLAAPGFATRVFYPVAEVTGLLPRQLVVGQARAPPATV